MEFEEEPTKSYKLPENLNIVWVESEHKRQ